MRLARALLPGWFAAAAVGKGAALDNGLGATPAMGYSTWNDCSSMRDNGPSGWCWNTEAHVKNVTEYLISSGLAKLGYVQVNIDEGWFKERNASGQMVEDFEKFPSGMKAMGDWIKAQPTYQGSSTKMKYGLYSCRGTCQCGTRTYHAEGSHGHEADDVDWMVNYAGADYLKIDSCCGNQNHATAFSDYAKFRDAMNKTGKSVWFSLCGWEEWYSPPDPTVGYAGGASLGNSWRIAGDGAGWGPLTNCMNVQAKVASYNGPGGWSDPDLLIGPKVYVGGQTDQQARAQFTMWSIFPANLLISQNVLQWSSYALETYSNDELIAVNQDKLGSPAQRIVGSDLKFPCGGGGTPGSLASVNTKPCDPTDPQQKWTYDSTSGTFESAAFPGAVLDDYQCGNHSGNPVGLFKRDGGAGTCDGKNQQWIHHPDGTITNQFTSMCLDAYEYVGPQVDVWGCNGGFNQKWTATAWGGLQTQGGKAEGKEYPPVCLAATHPDPSECTNVWGRMLDNNRRVLAFVNNAGDRYNITCDTTCFGSLNISASVSRLKVRDLWAHAEVAELVRPFTFSAAVNGSGFAAAYMLTPA